MPVLGWYAFRKQVSDKHTWRMRQFDRAYHPALNRALRHPLITAGIAAGIFAVSLIGVRFLGAEFMPTLDEGSIVVMMYRVPGISVTESLHGNEIIEAVLKEFPEVSRVVCRTGRPEVATDPMAIDQSDVYVALTPPGDWPKKRTNPVFTVAPLGMVIEVPALFQYGYGVYYEEWRGTGQIAKR